MKRILFFVFAFLTIAARFAGAQPVAVNSPADFAAGKELMAQLQLQARGRKPVTERPYVFVRSQTKYSGRLYDDYYLWHDRPLFASRKLWDSGASDMKQTSFAKTFALEQSYGLDGFLTFAWPGQYDRTLKVIYDTAAAMKLDPNKFHIMFDVSSNAADLEMDPKTLELIVHNPYSFRVRGKSVISSYILDRLTPQELEKYLKPLRERSGDKILVLPQIGFQHLNDANGQPVRIDDLHEMYRLHDGVLPASLLRQLQEYLRSYARVCDGLYLGSTAQNLDRTLDEGFFAQVLYPLYKSVLAEPEFNGKKLFAAQVKVGYTSFHSAQYLSRDGTKTLRKNFELARQFRPDIVIGTEWDEVNEDTSFQPQVAKPMSSQRIIKYYMSRFKGEPPTPNPGDDTSTPNLILSQRRQMLPGELLDIELLNVPDTNQGEPYTVALELLNEKGGVLYQAPPETFDSAQLKDKTFYLPSENFKDAQAIQPRLTINYRGKQQVLRTGLPFTVLRATTAWDQTYFCTPLRNVLRPQTADVKFAMTQKEFAPGVSRLDLSTNIAVPEKLAYAEVVQDSHVIFAYQPQNEYLQDDLARRLLRFTWAYNNNPSRIAVRFKVELKNAPSALTFMYPPNEQAPKGSDVTVKATASPAFTDSSFSWKQNQFSGNADTYGFSGGGRLISLNKADMSAAVLQVSGERLNGPHKGEKFDWELPLQELGDYGVISKIFEDGLTFSLETQYRPTVMPLPLDAATLKLAHPIVADNPHAVLALRLVSEDGKVFWSDPFALDATPSGNTVPVYVYSDAQKKGIKLELPASRVPDVKYDFTPRWGNILHTDAGRQFYGHAGGFLSIATAFQGLGSGNFSTPFYMFKGNMFEGADRPAPQWVEYEPGQWALSFDGERGNFLALPKVAIPQRAGFEVSFEIKPAEVKPEQVLMVNEGQSFGTFSLGVKDGKFQFYFTRRTPGRPDLPSYSQEKFTTKIPLRAGEWQKVVFSYDESKLTLWANGQSESFPFEGIGLYLQSTAFGGQGERTKAGVIPFYHGLLRALEIKHFVESTP